MIYEVVIDYELTIFREAEILFRESESFLTEQCGVSFKSPNVFNNQKFLDEFENSDKNWTYIYWDCKILYYFKSEIAAIEFKLRFG
jgi:hypothetical protein